MDAIKAISITETKTDSAQGLTEKAVNVPINKEQKAAIEKLEQALKFLKSVQIKEGEDLAVIQKPLDDLESSLKFIPTESYFNILPTEIKTNILDYLCDSNAFIMAAVCQEWRGILENRFDTGKVVVIGKYSCRNYPQCKGCGIDTLNSKTVMPEVMLKAAANHKLNVKLIIEDPIKEVDPKIVTAGLTSVSEFHIYGECTCDESEDSDDDVNLCELGPLSNNQLEDLFKGLEEKDEVMEKIRLESLDLTQINQDRLAQCLVNKTKQLELVDNQHGNMLDLGNFVRKLAEQPSVPKLSHLTLNFHFGYPNVSAIDLANALCKIKHVSLDVKLPSKEVEQIIQNILTRPVQINTLYTCDTFINPDDLKKLFTKMLKLRLCGTFTPEQIDAVQSLKDIQVSGRRVKIITK